MTQLSNAQARRVALGAQGFNNPRPSGRVDRRHLRKLVEQIGVIQIDSVNVLVRSQELPLFARLGPHPRSLIWEASAAGELFEYWVHVASHAPVALHPLMRWRMDGHHAWKTVDQLEERRPGYLDEVLDRIRVDGPLMAADLDQRVGKKGPWWDWDDGKLALEVLFHQGRVTGVRRQNDFARVYDLTENVIPAEILALPTPSPDEAHKELLVLAARHHGVGTLADLTDYYRLKMSRSRPLMNELVEDGRMLQVEVEGWSTSGYLHPAAKQPRQISARALLSPFDPVVWCRDRAERLFGFHYRIEIYVPEPKRQYGYYVLPFLLGDELVGRIDLKADRKAGQLLVQGSYGEPGINERHVAAELAAELRVMADWLELDGGVVVKPKGDLSKSLAASMA
ncbi:winged helix-turn-helix domain-containing protein [uncultured Ilumatobacter sp.]|uniref:winged helix-turn-helix domain-containing protein n=1 Tax=uncultured Ilumatobacter sp. TaxID=879968 RepID=UPI00374F5EF8